jgi:transcription elongation factor Elf1
MKENPTCPNCESEVSWYVSNPYLHILECLCQNCGIAFEEEIKEKNETDELWMPKQ